MTKRRLLNDSVVEFLEEMLEELSESELKCVYRICGRARDGFIRHRMGAPAAMMNSFALIVDAQHDSVVEQLRRMDAQLTGGETGGKPEAIT